MALAACQFMMGCSFTNIIYKVLNMEAGTHLKISALKKDVKRIKRAELAISSKAKKRRKQLKYKSIDKEKHAVKAEG